MNYPRLHKYYEEDPYEGMPLSNCTECTVSESYSDFTASLTFSVNAYGENFQPIIGSEFYEPNIRDEIEIKYSDGEWYAFKIESVSYSNGVWNCTAKYKGYETGGIVNEQMVGMFTPQGMIDYLNGHLHGGDIETIVTCEEDDDPQYYGISIQKPQFLRDSIYNQVSGITGWQVKPYNKTGLRLVKKRGSSEVKLISTKKNATSISVDKTMQSKPLTVIAYGTNDLGTYFGSSESWDGYASETELYDASESLGNWSEYAESTLNYIANDKLSESNKRLVQSNVSVKADLSPGSEMLFVGDVVRIYENEDTPYNPAFDSEERELRVEEVTFDSLHGIMLSVSCGDPIENISDTIAAQKKTITDLEYVAIGSEVFAEEDFDESFEVRFDIPNYQDGDVVNMIFETPYDDYEINPRISNITGNTFTIKIDEPPYEGLVIWIDWYLYYVNRKKKYVVEGGWLATNWTGSESALELFAFSDYGIEATGSSTAASVCAESFTTFSGYTRMCVSYRSRNDRALRVGFNTTLSTTNANPNMFYVDLPSGQSMATIDIPVEYQSGTGYCKVYGLSRAQGVITRIWLQQ